MAFGFLQSNTAKKVFHAITYGEVATAIFGMFMGRTTFFAIAFSLAGVYGWLVLNRDLTSFALFAGAIQTLLVCKSVSDDYNDRQNQNTTIVNNVTVDPNAKS